MSNKKILVVEDDAAFREAICDVLKKKYQVLEAPHGRIAMEIMNLTTIDLVVSDIQMEHVTGLELLEWSKKNKPTPFIITTGFSTLLETKTAYELGATGFLAKPFKNAELVSAVQAILPDKPVETGMNEDKVEFCMISIDEFIAKPKINFDVFIKLSENKTVKLAHKGDELPLDRLKNYKDKGVRFLYILKHSFQELVEFQYTRLKTNPEEAKSLAERKVQLLNRSRDILNDKVAAIGVERQSFLDAQNFLLMSLDLIAESKQHLTLLESLIAHSEGSYSHTLAVTLFSIMVEQKINSDSTAGLFKMMMASLYHDIGKKEIDAKILAKPKKTLTKDEVKILESHVDKGEEILSQIEGLSEDVVRMVSEHHEDLIGEGYPAKKKGYELHPQSKVLQAVNGFIDMTFNPDGQTTGLMDGYMSATFMEKTYSKRVDLDIMATIKTLLLKPVSQN